MMQLSFTFRTWFHIDIKLVRIRTMLRWNFGRFMFNLMEVWRLKAKYLQLDVIEKLESTVNFSLAK